MNTKQIQKNKSAIRRDWRLKEILDMLQMPLNDLIFQAQSVHRKFFDPNKVQLSTLLNIKTGGCPENCAYCPQSAHYQTGVSGEKMLTLAQVQAAAKTAKQNGASRFCMGAAWRSPRDRELNLVIDMIKSVKELGMESCATLGMLNQAQADRLKQAGLDFYNHNLDSSESFYKEIITTRSYQDRLDTLRAVRNAGLNVCCGGIIGMGEDIRDRAEMLCMLATMTTHPESVPINMLVRVEGTPLEDATPLEPFAMVRTIAVARIVMPASYVRLSAGRSEMSDEHQALCFLAGANSIFYGEKLLTTENPQQAQDRKLFSQLGIQTV